MSGERTRLACGRSRPGFANFFESVFRRDAETNPRDACASRDWGHGDYAPASASSNVTLIDSCLNAEGFGGKGIRTPDFQLAKLALYQLSYAPFRNSECRMPNVECNRKETRTLRLEERPPSSHYFRTGQRPSLQVTASPSLGRRDSDPVQGPGSLSRRQNLS